MLIRDVCDVVMWGNLVLFICIMEALIVYFVPCMMRIVMLVQYYTYQRTCAIKRICTESLVDCTNIFYLLFVGKIN